MRPKLVMWLFQPIVFS